MRSLSILFPLLAVLACKAPNPAFEATGGVVEATETDDSTAFPGTSSSTGPDGTGSTGTLPTSTGGGPLDMGDSTSGSPTTGTSGVDSSGTAGTSGGAYCGDGRTDPDEVCDDGNNVDDDLCSNDCKTTTCGNSQQDPGEGCDDGNDVDDDKCKNNCALPSCGDGVKDNFEQCDDGNADNSDGCLGTCMFPSCGNGTLEAPEQCDGEDLGGWDCTKVGFQSGTLGCMPPDAPFNLGCFFDVGGCSNGAVPNGEPHVLMVIDDMTSIRLKIWDEWGGQFGPIDCDLIPNFTSAQSAWPNLEPTCFVQR